MEATPGALAPQFTLRAQDGTEYSRSQFRNKSGLVLVFIPKASDAAVMPLLEALSATVDEFTKLKACIFIIAGQPPGIEMHGLIFLADADGAAWNAYSGLEQPAYGVFILDLYGGIDSQSSGNDPSALKDADTIREWMQAAMYKCSI